MPHCADHVSNQQNASPDEPAESLAEAVERRKLDDLTVDPIAMPVGEPAGNQQVQCGHDHETHSDQPAQLNLGYQDRPKDDPKAFLLEPEPIHQQVNTVGEEGQKNQEKQDKREDYSWCAIFGHDVTPEVSLHTARGMSKSSRAGVCTERRNL